MSEKDISFGDPCIEFFSGETPQYAKGGKNIHEGWRSPNHVYRIWNCWFPNDKDFVLKEELSPASIRAIRATLGSIQNIAGGPFINKWQRNSCRIRALSEILPEAVFLRIHRDEVVVAKSLLAGRRIRFRDEKKWYSAKPRNFKAIEKLNPVSQVCGQVQMINEDINEDIIYVGADRFFDIKYEDFCRDPEASLKNFKRWYERSTGSYLQLRGNNLPALKESKLADVDNPETIRIRKTLEAGRFQA